MIGGENSKGSLAGGDVTIKEELPEGFHEVEAVRGKAKKKRGRPRKYGPASSSNISIGLSPNPSANGSSGLGSGSGGGAIVGFKEGSSGAGGGSGGAGAADDAAGGAGMGTDSGKKGRGRPSRKRQADSLGVLAGDDVAPKEELPKGFYEVEAVRDKRVYKGKVQYLIKWRGSPESANTWEPKANLRGVSNLISVFEESLRMGKQSISKKGKRNSEVTHSRPEKKQKQKQLKATATYDLPLDSSKGPASEDVGKFVGPLSGDKVTKESPENGVAAFPTVDQHVNVDEQNGTPEVVVVEQGESERLIGSQDQHVNVVEQNGPPEVVVVEQGQSERLIGSRRRKSGFPKKFVISSDPREPCLEPTILADVDNVCCGGDNLDLEDNFDFTKNVPPVTRIVKPITWSTSVVNNVRELTVMFIATRSDGKEVLVDNKFLKAHNPLLLINYYEERASYKTDADSASGK